MVYRFTWLDSNSATLPDSAIITQAEIALYNFINAFNVVTYIETLNMIVLCANFTPSVKCLALGNSDTQEESHSGGTTVEIKSTLLSHCCQY